jgi:serine/threonine-protein kinase RsbT
MELDAPDGVVFIGSAADIVAARQAGRALASRLGFSRSDLTIVATAISEVARNIVEYAGRGEIRLSPCQQGGRIGLCVVATDKGPGIPDVERALRDGYSTHRGLGLGLPGARRLMDEFEIVSEVGSGTTVTMKKWAP